MSRLEIGQFVIVEWRAAACDPEPYAQAARTMDGWHCEVVSQAYLPASAWPIDELELRRQGWAFDAGDNWYRFDLVTVTVAQHLLAALRTGRLCPDAHAIAWRFGSFAPHPDGGNRAPAEGVDSMRVAA